MTNTQFRKALEALELTQGGAAELLGVSLRTAQNYALGTSPIPEGFARLLRLMIHLNLSAYDIAVLPARRI